MNKLANEQRKLIEVLKRDRFPARVLSAPAASVIRPVAPPPWSWGHVRRHPRGHALGGAACGGGSAPLWAWLSGLWGTWAGPPLRDAGWAGRGRARVTVAVARLRLGHAALALKGLISPPPLLPRRMVVSTPWGDGGVPVVMKWEGRGVGSPPIFPYQVLCASGGLDAVLSPQGLCSLGPQPRTVCSGGTPAAHRLPAPLVPPPAPPADTGPAAKVAGTVCVRLV